MTVDQHVVRSIAARLGEALVAERLRRDADGRLPLRPDDEVQFARSVVGRELDGLAAQRLASGRELLAAAEEAALADAVLARSLGTGRIQPLLDDPEIDDIHIRGCEPAWVRYVDGSRAPLAPVVDTDDELVELLRLIGARMGRTEQRFDAANPELNLQLPDGSRLFATMEVSARPSAIIRKHRFQLSSLDELRDRGMLDDAMAAFLSAAVLARRNIIVVGGTGSGKTTLLRALINEAACEERIVTIEDAYELAIDRFADRHPDHDMLQSRPPNIEGRGAITLADLTRMALRMDPDRVVVGEVRGAEAFPMLMAMSQGNNGSMCSMHADSSRTVFPKLAAYVAMADTGLPVETVNLLIATAVHFVVHVEIIDGVRRLTSVREVVDADGARIVSNEVFCPGPAGRGVPGFPMRDTTLAVLESCGFDPGLLDRHEGRWVR